MTARRIAAFAAFNLAALLLVIGLMSLAVWQMHRRAWKLDLIARVDARGHADPVPAPPQDRWPSISAAADEYRRVIVSGRWLNRPAALVKAVTEIGSGYWVMSPFEQDDGTAVLVNRGFVPDAAARHSWSTPLAPASLTGKLRMSEPGGGFLRSNDPGSDRWFSRDVAAIATSRGVVDIAPYFIDAEATSSKADLPVPGLTVLTFSNNHLVYALTWGTLALMIAAAAIFINLSTFNPMGRRFRFSQRRRFDLRWTRMR